MNKKCRLFIIISMLLCFSSGCHIGEVEESSTNHAQINLVSDKTEEKTDRDGSDFSKGDLKTMFEQVNNEEVKGFFYADYNSDNVHEAFVLTEDKLWFISGAGCEVVEQDLKNIDYRNSSVIDFNTKSYFVMQLQNKDGNSRVYSVDNDNKVMEPHISDKGVINVNQDGTMNILVSNASDTYEQDMVTYYIYYQYDNGFREYGAIPITESQFMEYEGAEEIIEGIYNSYEGLDIALSFLYRSNNIINVNILVNDGNEKSNYNLVLRYNTTGVQYESRELKAGKVETAYMLDIATYPTSFKRPIKKIAQ